ncbi:hypothetical protein WA1_20660 [Scytonema hofmannii PCC 7110]|uniref:Glycosyl transferase family 3 domain-containing protein n=1 Tax=Scytonema hofmannii PCC 7110 TaxID=128403 RepID=A0A139XCN8_9CYAN|nr:hypothetical protein [Scytonema hofmannii]KYC42382.1 hypothetical protein WA1_20660 [Scytonema hofmannii PCC 7110]
MYKFISKINKRDLQLLYSSKSINEKLNILTQLGPLQPIFEKFLEIESKTQPIENDKLIELFDSCSDSTKDVEELTETLRKLAPGNGQVGFHQVNFLVDRLRKQVWNYLQEKGYNLDLIPHDHAFGSGGDFIKTMHATTSASIVVAPLVTICKTGTTNVTSHHGSSQAMIEIGYNQIPVNPSCLKDLLSQYQFAFVSLADLGFPYSKTLKKARKNLWGRNLLEIHQQYKPQENNWQKVLQNLDIPVDIDIFKILAPNAQVLKPVHHSTGVCHLGMIPYVLGIYLHLDSRGIIYHSYDGIDEISNASTDLLSDRPNNLILKIDSTTITIAEFSPEDIGLERASLEEIKEEKNLKEEINTFWKIMSGDKQNLQAKRDFIVANAALLLVAGNQIPDLDGNIISQLRIGVEIAEHLIDSGKSYENFNRLLNRII